MQVIEQRRREYEAMEKHPFALTFFLSSPIVNNAYPILLDDVLTYVVAKELRGSDAVDADPRTYIDLPLPLEQSPAGYYFASMGLMGQRYQRGVTELVKRWSGEQAVDIGRGWSRSYLERISYIAVPFVTFYGVGHLEEVLRLAKKLPHLGKLGRMGFGSVKDVQIRAVERDESILSPEGALRRPVPVQGWTGDIPKKAYVTAMRIRSPYWSLQDLTLAYCPLPDSWLGAIQEEYKEKEQESSAWWEDDDL